MSGKPPPEKIEDIEAQILRGVVQNEIGSGVSKAETQTGEKIDPSVVSNAADKILKTGSKHTGIVDEIAKSRAANIRKSRDRSK